MAKPFQKVAILGKPKIFSDNSVKLQEIISNLGHIVCHLGLQVAVENATASEMDECEFASASILEIGQHFDVAIIVGGDGTMLNFSRQLAPYGTPIIGVNQGNLGFMADIDVELVPHLLPQILSGENETELRSVIQADVWRSNHLLGTYFAINEIVIHRDINFGMIDFSIEIDHCFVARQMADGLIVASPTGSTAYALSAGGPLLYPSLPCWLLVAIAPHNLSNRPLVYPNSSQTHIKLLSKSPATEISICNHPQI